MGSSSKRRRVEIEYETEDVQLPKKLRNVDKNI